MADAADQVAALDERTRADFEAFQRERRIQESMKGYDPTRPVNCTDCGDDIPPERLSAMPHTRRCARCAADVERSWPRPPA